MGFKDAGKPHFLGHRDRLRQRFRDSGGDALPDYELLELVLFRALPRRDTKPLAKELIAKFGSFPEVVNAPGKRLSEVSGVGDAVRHRNETHPLCRAASHERPGHGPPRAGFMVRRAELLPRRHGL